MKRCSVCGRTYSPAELGQLRSPGAMADEVERITLRDCPCGNTLAVTDLDRDRIDHERTRDYEAESAEVARYATTCPTRRT